MAAGGHGRKYLMGGEGLGRGRAEIGPLRAVTAVGFCRGGWMPDQDAQDTVARLTAPTQHPCPGRAPALALAGAPAQPGGRSAPGGLRQLVHLRAQLLDLLR